MNESQERLFFALWPDDRVRHRLSESVNRLPQISNQGRLVKSSNLHMTLHFIGNVPSAKTVCFISQAAKVQGRPFDLNLMHFGHFRKPRVLWIGCESVPPALSKLHADLGSMIETCGYTPESRPYRPHVTMARKIKQPLDKEIISGIAWRVDRFVLVQSTTQEKGVQYRVKASYPLCG